MGVGMPLTWGQLRICFVLIFLFAAIKIVLYTSATYDTSTATTPVKGKREDTQHRLSDHVLRKRRWKQNGLLVGALNIGGRGDSEGNRRGTQYSDKNTVRMSNKGPDGRGKLSEDSGKSAAWLNSPSKSTDRHQQATNTKPDISNMADSHKSDGEFDSKKVLELFHRCKDEDDNLSIDCYNDAYEELCKLFKPLGTVFNFVTSDIVEKIGILREYRKSDVGEHFLTVQTMVKYEVDNDLTVQKKKASGCRTLLRLHRALEFISALLLKIRNTDNSCKFGREATEAYDGSLAKHHPWLIKQAVHMAMYTLPDRKHMLEKMKVDDTPEGMAKVTALVDQLNSVYNVTEKLYADNQLLDLP